MTGINRRQLLQGMGGAAALTAFAGCGTSGGTSSGGDGTVKLVWWDHFGPEQDLNDKWLADYSKAHAGVQVDHQFYTGEKMWQAIQVAKQSNQMPDIFTLAGSDYPPAALIDQGWLQPIELTAEAKKSLPKGSLLDGMCVFDGKTYSFPMFSWRQYNCLAWFNKDLIQKAGLDLQNPPRTYDEFRQAARTVVNKTDADGYIWFFKTDVDGHVDDLAQAAGFEGIGGVEFKTGEYAYESGPYQQVIEFMHSLYVDKLMAPSSTSIDANQARLRFGGGQSAFWFEGPWAPGVLADQAPQFMDKLDVGPMLVPEPGMDVVTYRPPTGGVFWLGKNCQHPEEASKVMSTYASREYALKFAENMDQPPADLSIVEEAKAHPAWKKAISFYLDTTYLAPVAVVANPDESAVSSHIKPIQPTLGDIVEGVFAGKVKNLSSALKDLSERSTENRSKAIDAAKKSGADVSESMYAFPTWKPKQDFTPDKY